MKAQIIKTIFGIHVEVFIVSSMSYPLGKEGDYFVLSNQFNREYFDTIEEAEKAYGIYKKQQEKEVLKEIQ